MSSYIHLNPARAKGTRLKEADLKALPKGADEKKVGVRIISQQELEYEDD